MPRRRSRAARGPGCGRRAGRAGRRAGRGRPRRARRRSTARAAAVEVGGERRVGGPAVGDGAFLVALAEDPQHQPAPVDVVDVEPDQLGDPQPGGVEQLQHGLVAQHQRPLHPQLLGGAAVLGTACCGARGIKGGDRGDEHGRGLVGPEHAGQRPVGARGGQPGTRVGGDPAGAVRPAGERPGRGGLAGQRRAGDAGAGEPGQPAPQRREVESVQVRFIRVRWSSRSVVSAR